jgi:4a-hydroxytetrahydrobiopterin dehydratase
MARLLSDEEIGQRLASQPGWQRDGDSITSSRKLPGFSRAMLFAAAVGHLAETANHHPDITIQWDTVTLTLSTHSAGGLTDADFALAEAISRLG